MSLCFATGRFHEGGTSCVACARQDEILRRARHDARYLGAEVASNQARATFDTSWSLPQNERWKVEQAWRASIDAARDVFAMVCAEIREIVP